MDSAWGMVEGCMGGWMDAYMPQGNDLTSLVNWSNAWQVSSYRLHQMLHVCSVPNYHVQDVWECIVIPAPNTLLTITYHAALCSINAMTCFVPPQLCYCTAACVSMAAMCPSP